VNKPADPLVVTLRCSGAGWRYCEEQRRRHFPTERNLVPAHIALFHLLPGEELGQVRSDAGNLDTKTFAVHVTKVRSLGRGVAYVIDAPPLLALHRALSTSWKVWLTPQDRTKYSPHVTIQNKVDLLTARELLKELEASFSPFSFEATGLDIWHYRNGPWQPAASVLFCG